MRAHSRLHIESLEARDLPSGVADNFESATYPYAPGGWSQWSSTGSQYYQVNRTAVLSGTQSVAVFGNTNVESRIWQPRAQSGDVSLSLAVPRRYAGADSALRPRLDTECGGEQFHRRQHFRRRQG